MNYWSVFNFSFFILLSSFLRLSFLSDSEAVARQTDKSASMFKLLSFWPWLVPKVLALARTSLRC